MSNHTPRPPRRDDIAGPGRAASESRRATYTVTEVADLMGLSRGAVYAALRAGTIPAMRCGTRWVIPKTRFHAWLDTLPEASLEDVARECGIDPATHQPSSLDPADLFRARDQIEALDRSDLHLDDTDPQEHP